MGAAPQSPSAVAHHLHKLRPLLGEVEERRVSITVSDEEREEARRRFPWEPGAEPLLLHPGSTWPSKAWPEAKWSALIDRLAASGLGVPWILSSPGDEDRSRRIARSAASPVQVLEALPLRPLLALIAEARAYIGNDGGILHCAVALGTPTVGIFGPTEPEIWFPHEAWGDARLAQEFVHCRPCHLHHCDHLSCLQGLPVSRVARMLEQILDPTPSGVGRD
jgi:heptosyltransferase-2